MMVFISQKCSCISLLHLFLHSLVFNLAQCCCQLIGDELVEYVVNPSICSPKNFKVVATVHLWSGDQILNVLNRLNELMDHLHLGLI